MTNPFDQFDTPHSQANVFDQFDAPKKKPSAIQGLSGAYMSSALNGLMAQPTRAVMEALDTGHIEQRFRDSHPGQTDAWYKARTHEVYGQALTDSRQEQAQREHDNPYFGHQVGNFAAGVLGGADPTYAIPIPGVNGLTTRVGAGLAERGAMAAARTGARAAGTGALTGAGNVAAQGMDIAEGQRKDLDVKQALKASAYGAAFGGAVHVGLGEAPQFVQDLFKNRGVDTLPAANPRAATAPLTTERPTMTPEQTTQLRGLLQTGSVDDIKGFFADKQGPKPTWTEVNQLVEARDAIPEGTHTNYAEALDSHIGDVHANVVRDHIEQQMDGWRNKPDVEVIRKAEDIQDPAVRQTSIDQNLNHENTVGFVGPDGKVRVFADAVKGPSDVNAVLFHESLGHYGLRQRFGDTLDKTLHTLDFNNVGQFGKAVTKWIKDNPGQYKGNRIRAAEEVLAEMSQDGHIKPSVMDAFVGNVRRFGRQMGMKLSYSDTEVKNILRMAHDAVVNGHGRDAGANSFRFKRSENDFDGPWVEKADEPTGFGIEGSKINAEDIRNMSDEADQTFAPEGPGRLPDEDVKQIADENMFMTPDQLDRKGQAERVHEDAYNHFSEGYKPKYRSIEETYKAAKDTALDPSQIRKTKNVGELDKKLFIYDNAAKQANARMMLLAKEAETNGGLNHDQMNDLIKTASEFHYVLSRLDNDLGEVGRALNVAKQLDFRRSNILELKKALEGEDSPLAALMEGDNATVYLKQFAQLFNKGNTNGAAQLLKGVNKPYWWQYLLTWRSNMLLSGLSTHLKNPMDMATTAGRELEEKLMALPAGAVRDLARSVGMKNVQQGVHPTEVAAQAWGITRSLLSASTYKDAADAFVHGGYQRFGVSGIQNPRIPVVSKVTDALAAMDVFFRTILDNGNLHALGVREARKAGLTKWDDITTAAAGHAMHPTRGMLKEAQELSEHTMLINESSLNDAINRAKRIRPGMNGPEQFSAFATNYLTPFIRVQSNALMNQIVRRSPLSFLDPITRADFKAGGARRDIAVARTVMGSALMALYWQAAGKDKVTDQGPDNNYNKLQEMEASGWRPGATHDKGRYNANGNLNLSLNPFDLHNNVASLVAGVRQAYDEGANKKNVGLSMKLSAAAIMSALTKQTFVNDIGEAWDAFRSPGETGSKKAERFLGNEAKTFLPNLTTQAAKMVDPIARDTSQNPIVDIPHSAIPFASKSLPAQHTTYGEEKKTGTGISGVHTWLSQGNGQNEVSDPVHVEMARLGDLFDDTLVGPVQRTITGKDIDKSRFNADQITDAGNVRLTAEQFQEYQRMAGEDTTERVRDAMDDPSWADMSDEEKADRVHKISTDSKKAVKRYLYGRQGTE